MWLTLFLSILMELLANRLQEAVVDDQSIEYRNVISSIPQGRVLVFLFYFSYYILVMCGLI